MLLEKCVYTYTALLSSVSVSVKFTCLTEHSVICTEDQNHQMGTHCHGKRLWYDWRYKFCINFDDVHTNYYRLFDVIYIYSHKQCDSHTIYIQIATVCPRTRKYSALSARAEMSLHGINIHRHTWEHQVHSSAAIQVTQYHTVHQKSKSCLSLHVYIICMCKAYLDCRRYPMLNPSIRSETTAGGVWCLGLPYGPKTDRNGGYKSLLNGIWVNAYCDHDCNFVNQVYRIRGEITAEGAQRVRLHLAFLLCLVIALPSQRSMDSGIPDCVWIRHHLYWSLDHKEVPGHRTPSAVILLHFNLNLIEVHISSV